MSTIIQISMRNQLIVARIVEKLLDTNPDHGGSPIRHRDHSDGYGNVECGLCGATWQKPVDVKPGDHMDYCPVRMADDLEKQETKDDSMQSRPGKARPAKAHA